MNFSPLRLDLESMNGILRAANNLISDVQLMYNYFYDYKIIFV